MHSMTKSWLLPGANSPTATSSPQSLTWCKQSYSNILPPVYYLVQSNILPPVYYLVQTVLQQHPPPSLLPGANSPTATSSPQSITWCKQSYSNILPPVYYLVQTVLQQHPPPSLLPGANSPTATSSPQSITWCKATSSPQSITWCKQSYSNILSPVYYLVQTVLQQHPLPSLPVPMPSGHLGTTPR